MSVVVRMEMPHDGLCDLAFSFLDRTCCTIEGNLCNYCDDGVIPKWCPIICSLPEGHGRLVDADATVKDIRDEILEYKMAGLKGTPMPAEHLWLMKNWIADDDICPTIVPAERSEKDGR